MHSTLRASHDGQLCASAEGELLRGLVEGNAGWVLPLF